MRSQAHQFTFKNLCVLASLGALAFAPLVIAETKKPKYTVKEVMQAIHGPHVARTEVISLTMFDGPLTVA